MSTDDRNECSVCYDARCDTQIVCGHTFCYRCISESLRLYDRCPLCRHAVEMHRGWYQWLIWVAMGLLLATAQVAALQLNNWSALDVQWELISTLLVTMVYVCLVLESMRHKKTVFVAFGLIAVVNVVRSVVYPDQETILSHYRDVCPEGPRVFYAAVNESDPTVWYNASGRLRLKSVLCVQDTMAVIIMLCTYIAARLRALRPPKTFEHTALPA